MKFARLGAMLSLFSSLLIPITGRSVDYAIQLGTAFSGSAPAGAMTPWLSVWVQQASPGVVQITFHNLNLVGSENVDGFYLNLNPALDPTRLSFAVAATSGGFDLPAVYQGANQFQADGDGKYDVKLAFNTGGTAGNRFTAGEYLSYSVFGVPELTTADFGFLSAPGGGSGPFYAAAHVQRVGAESLSGWVGSLQLVSPIPVPEPAAAALLGLAALATSFWRRPRIG
jgi:hypothetical protein